MKCPKCQFENPPDTLYCGKCATPLPSPKDASVSQTKTLETPTEELTRGSTFAERYEIIEELGKGGMGKVYRVEDKKINEEVALKLIRPEIAADKKIIARFSNELKFARKIRHKNVCQMFDLGEEKGRHFITMEYVPGEDLKSLIKRVKQLTSGTAISIAKQVCDGLAEAHRIGVVHRDLKPSNIMIDKEGNARIMDFGIARSLKTKGITGEGIIVGTPDYMSPEQVSGKEADQRSDVYSLGVILYEMVTGGVPFEGDTALSIALKHKSEEPEDPRNHNPQISEDLSVVILKCLEKDKEDRFQSAEELHFELSKIEKKLSSTERILFERKTTGAAPKKRFLSFVIPGILVLIPIIIVAGLFILKGKKKPDVSGMETISSSKWKNSIAVLLFRDLSPNKDKEHLCFGITDAINDRLTQLGELKVSSTTSVMRYKNTKKLPKEIGKELDVANILEGTVQVEGNRIRVRSQLVNAETGFHLWSKTYEQELQSLFDIQDEVSKTIADILKLKVAPEALDTSRSGLPKDMEAYEYYLKGKYFIESRYCVYEDEKDFDTAIQMYEKAVEIEPDYALAHFGMAGAYENHYVNTQDKNSRTLGFKAGKTAYQLDPNLSEVIAGIGYQHFAEGEYDKGYQKYQKALELDKNNFETNFCVGCSSLVLGLHHQTIKFLSRAMELNPYFFWIYHKLGKSSQALGEFEKAAIYFKRGRELYSNKPLFLCDLVQLLIMMGEYDDAEEIIADAEKIDPDHAKIQYVDIVRLRSIPYYKALLFAARGDKEKALSLRKGVDIYSLLGMKEEAIELLSERIKKGRVYHYDVLANNPFYDNLRSDPRFEEIVKKLKKKHEELVKKYGNL